MEDPIKEAVASQAFKLLDLDGLDIGHPRGDIDESVIYGCQFQSIGKFEALFWVPTQHGPRRCFKIKISEVM